MPEQNGTPPREPSAGAINEELPSDENEQLALGARLKEAREYIGLVQEDVSVALGIPRTSVHALEAGKRKVTGLELRRLARLYRRPVAWLLGDEVELNEAEPLFRAAAALSEADRVQVLRFAEFLAAAGKPGGGGGRRATLGIRTGEGE
jgi:transcriptional regulator with XRE-family HTH domain